VLLTPLDFLLWAAGFAGNVALLFVLLYRERDRRFPFFTALIAMNVARTLVLFFVLRYAARKVYFYAYWSFALIDTSLQLAVVYEVASRVFRPLEVWAHDLRDSFAYIGSLSIAIALGLSFLASPASRTWIEGFTVRGDLFAAALLSELFVAMMALSMHAGLPWKTHVAKIAQGLGGYSLITVVIEGGHTYFGVGRELGASSALSHIRMAAYLGCVTYWAVNLWREERPVFEVTEDMREKLFTLQTRVEYYLRDLRSREK
jgi:hypothetical protein